MKTTAMACCLVALSLLGCRSADPADSAALPLGIDWSLATMITGDDSMTIAPGEEPPTLRFTSEGEGMSVSGFSGVNRYSGTCTVAEDRLMTFSPLAATRMAGPPGAMDLEVRFLAHLQGARSYVLAGEELSILTRTGSLEFRAD